MRFKNLIVKNFRSIRNVELSELADVVILVGPNGCGKSTVLDAIRFLKSWYGEYSRNEIEHWYQERGINHRVERVDYSKEFRDPMKSCLIQANVELLDAERQHVLRKFDDLYLRLKWQEVYSPHEPPPPSIEIHRRLMVDESGYQSEKDALRKELESKAKEKVHELRIEIPPDGQPKLARSLLMRLAFSMWDPEHVGVVDYRGPHRTYKREKPPEFVRNRGDAASSQHALYNTNEKFSNIKNELQAGFLRDLIARAAETPDREQSDFARAVSELFKRFIPSKSFRGPIPTRDGGLKYEVNLETGGSHDIDELSSGEKELIFGYMRLKNDAPRNSMLLIDEPELHLNPGLISGLPEFYHDEFGKALGNQIWMATHSDTLVRQTVPTNDFAVYHLKPTRTETDESNQANRIDSGSDLDNAIVDLLGDIAIYRPGAKVILLEGGGDQAFDRLMVERLFPNLRASVNLVAAGNKLRVRRLQELLEKIADQQAIQRRFYSIVDRDGSDDGPKVTQQVRQYEWDAYHIENYLLEDNAVYQALITLKPELASGLDRGDIPRILGECAEATMPALIRHRLHGVVRQAVRTADRLAMDSQAADVDQFRGSVKRAIEHLTEALDRSLSKSTLDEDTRSYERQLRLAITTNNWRKEFRGREVLTEFCARYQVPYSYFRNVCLAKLIELDIRPPGMKKVIDEILSE